MTKSKHVFLYKKIILNKYDLKYDTCSDMIQNNDFMNHCCFGDSFFTSEKYTRNCLLFLLSSTLNLTLFLCKIYFLFTKYFWTELVHKTEQ